MNEQTNLIFYSAHAREMLGSTKRKIQAILLQKAIEYVRAEGNNHYICKPINNPDGSPYNSTTYEMRSHKIWGWTCNCQAFTMRMKKHMGDPINIQAPSCSHTAAMWEYIKRLNMGRMKYKEEIRHEKMEGGMQMIFGVD